MRAGELREIIELLKEQVSTDSYGQTISNYIRYSTIRANIIPNDDVLTSENNERLYLDSINVTCRMHVDIMSTDRILYNNKVYSIRSINRDRLKQCITIVADEIND